MRQCDHPYGQSGANCLHHILKRNDQLDLFDSQLSPLDNNIVGNDHSSATDSTHAVDAVQGVQARLSPPVISGNGWTLTHIHHSSRRRPGFCSLTSSASRWCSSPTRPHLSGQNHRLLHAVLQRVAHAVHKLPLFGSANPSALKGSGVRSTHTSSAKV